MAKIYKIHPAIGIARVGNSSEHFVGPEIPGIAASPPDGRFKAAGQVKRQAARFRVFEYDDSAPGVAPVEITLGTASIEWTVHLANRKAAWYKFQGLTGEDGNYPPNSLRNRQIQPTSPTDVESGARRALIIDPRPRRIAGADQEVEVSEGGSGTPDETWPPPFVNGRRIQSLGTLYTDEAGRLKVAGGYGTSGTPNANRMPPVLPDIQWNNNDEWWDDVSDGPVTATLVFQNGERREVESPAWVVVGVPDFAPTVDSIVTAFDVLYDLAVRRFALRPDLFSGGQFRGGQNGYRPSYTREIYPIIKRAADQRWVFRIAGHNSLMNHNVLGKLLPNDPTLGARRNIFQRLNNPDAPHPFGRPPLVQRWMPWLRGDEDEPTALTLTRTQYFLMSQWRQGFFVGDWNGVPAPAQTISPDGLDLAALEGISGGAFYPGMEVGWIIRNPAIYRQDTGPVGLRIIHRSPQDPDGLMAGDLTKRMALPWQADFNACNGNWWPAHRPQDVRIAGLPTHVPWDAPQPGQPTLLNFDMVDAWHQLGFVKGDPNGSAPLLEGERNWPR
ncbi:MAG: LodA/GoxA family CTQ-dependent oxidase [Longimicrobiaceae bacterium]